MELELVHTTTSDKFRLDGAWFEPDSPGADGAVADAILLIHGAGTNFYQPLLLDLAQQFSDQGYGVATFNNTGHDSLWARNEDWEDCCWRNCSGCPSRVYGASVEEVDWCRTDVRACLDWLGSRGFSRIIIAGHSLGAVKAIYYQSKYNDSRVVAVVAISPPRLSYSYLTESEEASQFGKNYAKAERLISEGRPGELMRVTFPSSNYFSAANYVNKLGPREKANVMKLAEKIEVPLLALGGSKETRMVQLRDVPADLAEAAVNSPRRDWHVVDGANHIYSGKTKEAAGTILSWLASLNYVAGQPSLPQTALGHFPPWV